ncbi:hypothetical protein D3C72_505300 [compost metagenome]
MTRAGQRTGEIAFGDLLCDAQGFVQRTGDRCGDPHCQQQAKGNANGSHNAHL